MRRTTGRRRLETVKSQHFDLILLDVGLPDMDGRDVCRLLRRSNVRVPVIMLTAADSDADAILGLDSGANDYVAKPFKLGVLLARIRAQLRQFERSEDAVFAIGPFSFRSGAKMLVVPETDEKIRLTEKEAAILKYLLRAGSVVVARDVLLNQVWGYNSGRYHAHAGNPCLPAAPENRAGSIERRNPGHRNGRLPADPIRRMPSRGSGVGEHPFSEPAPVDPHGLTRAGNRRTVPTGPGTCNGRDPVRSGMP